MATTDLVHDPEERRLPLQRFRFLLGHFRGEGQYVHGTNVFHKEMDGTWEAGGRFIGLRMSVTYPLGDGRKDIHEAFIMIGAQSASGLFEAQAYTDGGAVQTYHLDLQGDTISFDDQPPTLHGIKIVRARKSLTPTVDGFEERLDIDRGTGHFEPYSVVTLRRVAGC